MDQSDMDNDSLIARVQQLERERDDLHKDIEQLCMQQAGPAYLGVATRLHFQRTAALELEVENLKKKLATCTRDNQNIQEELSEAYRIKSHLADLLSAEVSKNAESEKQLKFFQGCVATAFAERDNAIMEAEKAKEKEESMPQELDKFQKKVDDLTCELVEEKKLVRTLQEDLEKLQKQNDVFKEVVDKFYNIRQYSTENSTDVSWEEKCNFLLDDAAELWRFQDDEDTSTSDYILLYFHWRDKLLFRQSSLEAEVETLRRRVDNLQNKLRVGLEIESHLKKKVRTLEKEKILSEEKIKQQISPLLQLHSQYRMDIVNLLDEGYSELNSVVDLVVEKIGQLELCREQTLDSSPVQDTELPESECRDVHVNVDSALCSPAESNGYGLPNPPGIDNSSESLAEINDPGLAAPHGTDDTSEGLAQALQEKNNDPGLVAPPGTDDTSEAQSQALQEKSHGPGLAAHPGTDDTFEAQIQALQEKSNDPQLAAPRGTNDTSEVFAQALQEKVSALLLMSQQEERHLLERNVNAALQKKIDELQRNLLQVTNEKVRALMELAQIKQERYILQDQEASQGKQLGETREQGVLQEKDWKFKTFLKKSYLTRWSGGSDNTETHRSHDKPNKHMDFARMRIENATLKESLDSMEHLLSSVRRLRSSLLKLKDSSAVESTKSGIVEDLDQIVAETRLFKTALSSSLPVSWSADNDGSYSEAKDIRSEPGHEKVDFVSAAGLEMVELLMFAALVLKDQVSHQQ